MSTPVVTVAPTTPVAEAARLLNAHGFKAVPVVRDGGSPGSWPAATCSRCSTAPTPTSATRSSTTS
ncbi:CBS domain-containing protein [Actinomadura luteofluorescens]|uniref:CBS domain-containing protein n=1 Tax=Actinomadura luteofluorescens TaxID=46163 RepID=UPI0036437F12